MNTNTINTRIDWPEDRIETSRKALKDLQAQASIPLHRASRFSKRLLWAMIPTSSLIIVSTLAIANPQAAIVLQAIIWAAGFIFLALAVDSDRAHFEALIITGLALPVLAVLSSQIAVVFAIPAAGIIAAWITISILKR